MQPRSACVDASQCLAQKGGCCCARDAHEDPEGGCAVWYPCAGADAGDHKEIRVGLLLCVSGCRMVKFH